MCRAIVQQLASRPFRLLYPSGQPEAPNVPTVQVMWLLPKFWWHKEAKAVLAAGCCGGE